MTTSPPNHSSPIVRKGLDIYLKSKRKRQYLAWGSINAVLLSIIVYDIRNKCPFAYSKWYYVEYAIAAFLGLSVLYYFSKYIFLWLTFKPIRGTQLQRKLLSFEDAGKIFHFYELFISGS